MAKILVVPADPPHRAWEATAGALSARLEVQVARTNDPRMDEWIDHVDVPVYHVDGNAGRSVATYKLALRRPGIVVLHDLDMEGLVRSLVRDGDPLAEQALREAQGDRSHVPLVELGGRSSSLTPWSAQLVRRSRGVITHSAFQRRYLVTTRSRTPVFAAPHPVVDTPVDSSRAQALRSELPSSELVVVALCDPSAARFMGALVPAIADGCRLVVIGSAAEVAGVGDHVTVPAPESRRDVRSWVQASDVVVNLGHPGWSEARELMAAAQLAAKPVVTTTAWLSEGIPENAVSTVGPIPQTEELAGALGALAGDPSARDSMGRRLREDALARCTPEATADVYARAVNETLTLLDDPIRNAVLRWASGLAECGATIDLARAGLGARFADEIGALRAGT